ncbi:hypothetical protein Tco_0580022, partial [Tanacetum coccineum]
MVDFGPFPFRFFHSWLDMDGFSNMVKETWINGCATDANFLVRRDSMKTLGEIDHIEVSDLCQKSKLKWARDG